MPDTRPRVVFNDEGICNACLTAQEKNNIDWDLRRAEFKEYVEQYRAKTGPYDCIVPWSGGKDSSYIAHKLKFEFGLNPLLVTFSPVVTNEIGAQNRDEFLKLGFDHLMVRPNQKISRLLAKRFFKERGNPKVCWDAGINAVPIQVAVKYNIPLVFYAEHGESEYGGRLLNQESNKIRDLTEVLEHQIGDYPGNWIEENISEADLAPYLYPEVSEIEGVGVKAMYFAYFFRWNINENFKYMKKVMPTFQTAGNGRSEGTFTDFDSLDDKIDSLYFYLQHVKFGFGRATRDACRMINNKIISREQAIAYAREYDDEYPAKHMQENLDFLDMNETEFREIIDLHRNKEIWEMLGNKWNLVHPL